MSLDIKICGLKTEAALAAALAGGASHVGFIFFPKSPRNIEPDAAGTAAPSGARQGRSRRRDGRCRRRTRSTGSSRRMQPDMLQLHGGESPERVALVKARYGLPVMKVLSIRTAADLDAVAPYRGVADRLMFDAKPPAGSELPGGNGVSFDWRLLAGLDAGVDYMLSGGPQRRQYRRGPCGWRTHPASTFRRASRARRASRSRR